VPIVYHPNNKEPRLALAARLNKLLIIWSDSKKNKKLLTPRQKTLASILITRLDDAIRRKDYAASLTTIQTDEFVERFLARKA
jgi:hypothetical protein